MTASLRFVVPGATPRIAVSLPLKLTNPLNNRRHWRSVWAQSKTVRGAVSLALRSAVRVVKLPVVVLVTRVAPSVGLDPHDGLRAACKPAVDGVADALGLRSDRTDLVTWTYAQRRGPYAVEIQITNAARGTGT